MPHFKTETKALCIFLKLHKRKCLVNFFTQMKRCCEDPIPYGAMWPATFEPSQWGNVLCLGTHIETGICVSVPSPHRPQGAGITSFGPLYSAQLCMHSARVTSCSLRCPEAAPGPIFPAGPPYLFHSEHVNDLVK